MNRFSLSKAVNWYSFNEQLNQLAELQKSPIMSCTIQCWASFGSSLRFFQWQRRINFAFHSRWFLEPKAGLKRSPKDIPHPLRRVIVCAIWLESRERIVNKRPNRFSTVSITRKSIYKKGFILKMTFSSLHLGASMARMLMGRYRGEWKVQ